MDNTPLFTQGNIEFGSGKLAIFAGPCVLEGEDKSLYIAQKCAALCEKYGFNYVFKASFDKANRTSIKSFRGPGMDAGLSWLKSVSENIGVPVITDIHETQQAKPVAEVAQYLQIPAFLCRQTDLIAAAASTGRTINVKKAQYMAPEDMASVVGKCAEVGNEKVILCDRGTMFGYRNLVVDLRCLTVMRALGCPVMFDATHSVQTMGGMGGHSGGERRFILQNIRAALAVGIDALFMEVHPDPAFAPCDGSNMIPLDLLPKVLENVKIFHDACNMAGITSLHWAE